MKQQKLAVSNDIQIRKIDAPQPADAADMLNTLNLCNEENLGVKRQVTYIGAYADNRSIGGIMFRRYGTYAVIDSLAIEKEYRGQGIGKRLVIAAEEELARAGCRQIIIFTMAYQVPGLYRSMGYQQVAHITDYLGGHDQLTFRKILPSGEKDE